ncbi:RluA family pseudouridine synthase [Termitidicoccus mucosus]|uniref:Pseudouridine synthase n=1 Tax=Termitidicoccus mucosus TaxID=1184151 RepID=A0A178IMA8_9BACT|nr:RNA pseudouridine synthase [Opitutaceae bacterium TSB47]
MPNATLTHTVPPGIRRIRADKALAIAFPGHSRVAIQRAFDAGLVSFDGRPIKRDHAVHGGDTLAFSMPDARPSELKPVAIPLDILFEDRHLLAINKAAGMVVHPGAATGEDTLVHALLAHCKGGLSGVGGVERPGIVHRLDRETSGVMLVAKTDAAHRGLSEQFSTRALQKEYLALVAGTPALLSGSIRKPIGRNPHQRHKMMAFEESHPAARDAHTDWEVVESYGALATLVRCRIHTGRTHQIRVHLKSLGHVLLGDTVYGWHADPRLPVQPSRVMLHAEHLVVHHPVTGKLLDLTAPPPKDFKAMQRALKTATKPSKKRPQKPKAVRP